MNPSRPVIVSPANFHCSHQDKVEAAARRVMYALSVIHCNDEIHLPPCTSPPPLPSPSPPSPPSPPPSPPPTPPPSSILHLPPPRSPPPPPFPPSIFSFLLHSCSLVLLLLAVSCHYRLPGLELYRRSNFLEIAQEAALQALA
eukprot:664657-Hanusia_phi.AAC.1